MIGFVTFDCWNTVLRDRGGEAARADRVAALAWELGLELDEADTWVRRAWDEHVARWTAGEVFASREMVGWILDALHADAPGRRARLVERFERATLAHGAAAVEGAAETLAALDRRGIPVALICDTGYSPGRVVRELLRANGLEFAAYAFSDEVGAPKPARVMFTTALDALGAPPDRALHLGDLRRTDVAGSRAAGMTPARFRGVFDDPAPLPEADLVLDSLQDLLAQIGPGRL